MEAFFVSIILIGILVVCFALVWMVIEKKRAMDYRLEIDERRYELMQIIEDADQLLTEMNNFSSYIVDQMEEKQQSIEFSLHKHPSILIKGFCDVPKAYPRELNNTTEPSLCVVTGTCEKSILSRAFSHVQHLCYLSAADAFFV